MADEINLCRGMLPFRPEAVGLKFKSYLVSAQLPTVPATFGYVRRNDIPWRMLANDRYGDCVVAGAAHETMLWHLGAGKPMPTFDDHGITSQYLHLSGGVDDGLDPVMAARWRVSNGIADTQGNRHKLSEYALIEIDDLETLDLATYIFGAVGFCWNLPNSAEKQFMQHHVWDDSGAAASGSGHYTPMCGKNSHGERMFITWGVLQAATEAYCRKFMQGAMAYVSLSFLNAKGLSPTMLDQEQLTADWHAMHTRLV